MNSESTNVHPDVATSRRRASTARAGIRLSARPAILISAISLGALTGACDKLNPPPLPPAVYAAPPAGTVLKYRGFSNKIVSNVGWVSSFSDDSGHVGKRIGAFMVDDPKNPISVDTSKLSQLWPLKAGTQVSIPMSQGKRRWEWRFNVAGDQEVEVAAGTFKTFLVEVLQVPIDSTGKPGKAATVGYIWNYAPSVNAIVKFGVTIMAGPSRGKSFGSELQGIDPPRGQPTAPGK